MGVSSFLYFSTHSGGRQRRMGAAQSRRGAQGINGKKFNAGKGPSGSGNFGNNYFILTLSGEKIKVVNVESTQLKILTSIIKRHCKILKEGWDRHLTFCFRLKPMSGRHCMIQLIADTLLTLYRVGREPMTPIE